MLFLNIVAKTAKEGFRSSTYHKPVTLAYIFTAPQIGLVFPVSNSLLIIYSITNEYGLFCF